MRQGFVSSYCVTTITGATYKLYMYVHVGNENQTTLQNRNKEFHLQLFGPISFSVNTMF